MTALVVDASVVATAFFQEQYADAARLILSSGQELHAPDLLVPELANVIWKRHGRGEIDDTESRQLLADLLRLPLRLMPSRDLAEVALELALKTRRTVYDCMYLALAIQLESVLVSGDKRFVIALADTPLDKHVAWLGRNE